MPSSRRQKTKPKSEEVTEKADLGGYGKSNSSCVCVCVCDGEALWCDPTLSAISADQALICGQKCCKKQLHTGITCSMVQEMRLTSQVSKTTHPPSSLNGRRRGTLR